MLKRSETIYDKIRNAFRGEKEIRVSIVIEPEGGIDERFFGEKIDIGVYAVGSSYDITHTVGIQAEDPKRLENLKENMAESPMGDWCEFEIDSNAETVNIKCSKHSVVKDEVTITSQIERDRRALYKSGLGYYFSHRSLF